MKRSFIIMISLSWLLILSCHSITKTAKTDDINGNEWYKNQELLNGLNVKPHKSINEKEFSRQYHLNNIWWDKAFEFLKTHDLASLDTGNYVIDSGNVIAMVLELRPKDSPDVNWEDHHDFNDLQYVIKGKAGMGVASITDPDAKVIIPYSKKSDTETFTVSQGAHYYTAEPGSFFIFTPEEIHRPAFKLSNYDSIKKIIIKVRVPSNPE